MVKAIETKLLEIATAQQTTSDQSVSAYMEMGVINLRTDLFPWYEAQGYALIGEIRPNHEEITRIILDDLDVCCVLMRKKLL